jgi:uncharacterized Zn-binding protein involved in type VI secretion
MGVPAAKEGDQVLATDVHIVLVPAPPRLPVPTPLPHPFTGTIDGSVTSTAQNTPPHLPTPPGTAFVVPPSNIATIILGSMTVLINGKPAARNGDVALTCDDPVELPVGRLWQWELYSLVNERTPR